MCGPCRSRKTRLRKVVVPAQAGTPLFCALLVICGVAAAAPDEALLGKVQQECQVILDASRPENNPSVVFNSGGT